jgi:sodium/potassium-transporting ATPase subunit alpha
LLGNFATATAIAQQVGIIVTLLHAIKHLADLPYDVPLEEIPALNDDKEKGEVLTSLVLSSPEMNTKSRWKQVLTVSI